MVFNATFNKAVSFIGGGNRSATFNNISVISWRSVLIVDEIGENQQPVANH